MGEQPAIRKTSACSKKQPEVFFHLLLILLAGILIYSNTFSCSFQFDDFDSIVTNPSIRSITDSKAIWDFWPNRFITYCTIALNYHFNRLDVVSYHLFNLLVHLLAALLVRWFILLIFASPGMKNSRITGHAGSIAFFTALLFVCHPLQTQAVTYIIQRATSLAALFYLATLCFYAKARLSPVKTARRRSFYILAIVTALLALFTKEPAITLPLMLLLVEAYFFKAGKMEWKKLSPFLFLLCVIPLIMLLTKSVNVGDMHRVSEAAPGIPQGQYFLTQLRVMVTYLRLVFFPFNQNIDYDYPLAQGFFQPGIVASLLLLAGMLIAGFAARSRSKLLSFSIFWFFILLLPESSLIPLADVIFEHRLYLPIVGSSLFLITGLYMYFDKRDDRIPALVLSGIAVLFMVATYSRNFSWTNEISLWNDAISKSPDKARPYNERGIAFARLGNYEKALEDFDKAIRLNHAYHLAYYNRGNVYKAQGSYDAAIADYNRTIKINPGYFEAFNNLGTTYAVKGDMANAILSFSKALELNPFFAQAYYNRATAYISDGNIDKARADYAAARKISPAYDSPALNKILGARSMAEE